MKIDILKIASDYGISKDQLAIELFKGHLYPINAFNRVISTGAMLREDQIVLLSNLTGLSIAELFTYDGVKHSFANKIHTFKSKNFSIIYNIEDCKLSVHGEEGKLLNTFIQPKLQIASVVSMLDSLEADKLS